MDNGRLADAQMACARLMDLRTATGRRGHLAALDADELTDVVLCLAQTVVTVAAEAGVPEAGVARYLRGAARMAVLGRPCRCGPCSRGLHS